MTQKIPFYDEDREVMFRNVVENELEFPKGLSSKAQRIITEVPFLLFKLLEKNPEQRLGTNGADEIKKHPFF